MSNAVVPHDLPFLSEISDRDKTWDLRKTQACKLAQLYKGTQFNRLYERILFCAHILTFELASTEDEFTVKLKDAFFCRVRHCPICQWRRARMWFGKFLNVLPEVLEDYPSARFIHLTLTVRNCDINDLRSTLIGMNKAWQRLTQRKQFRAVLGWVKSVEFTRNTDTDTVHPHFHALLMVQPSYFKKHYVSHENWVKTWRECLRVDYDPSVRVQTIKPKNPLPPALPALPLSGMPSSLPPGLPGGLVESVCEVVKYSVKPQDLAIGGEWVLTLTEQLRGTKAISLGGILRAYLSDDEEDEDLIVAGLEDEDDKSAFQENAPIVFGWRDRFKKYQLNPDT